MLPILKNRFLLHEFVNIQGNKSYKRHKYIGESTYSREMRIISLLLLISLIEFSVNYMTTKNIIIDKCLKYIKLLHIIIILIYVLWCVVIFLSFHM